MASDIKREQTRIKSGLNEITTNFGKIPPQAIDLEEAVLGAVLLEKTAITTVIDFLNSDMFYKEAHQKIYQAATNLFDRSEPIDIMTVTNELKQMGDLELVGGAYAVTMLTSRIATSSNIEYHARIVVQKYMGRSLISTCSDLINKAYEDTTDVFKLLDAFSDASLKHSRIVNRGRIVTAGEVAMEVKQHSERVRSGEIKQDGIQTHITKLNEIIYGFRAPDVMILAGRPGMGKTALLVSFMLEIAKNNIPVGVFSLEMSAKQLTYRMASQLTGISYQRLIRAERLSATDYALFEKALYEITSLPIFIDDTSAITIRELRAKGKEMSVANGVKIIFIDYLQLMGSNKDRFNREAQIADISRGVKQLAKDLDVPVVPLAQLSRKVEERPDKRPKLADLRESGSLEQDADIVMFMFRPKYYKITEDSGTPQTYSKEEMRVLCELEIAKHRNGPIGTIPMKFNEVTMRYTDLDLEDDTVQVEMDLEEDESPLPF